MQRIVGFLIAVLMNLWVYLILFLWTVIGSLISLPAWIVFRTTLRWRTPKIMHYFVWIYGKICMLIFQPFVQFRKRHLLPHRLPASGIIIMNHYSFFDTFMLGALPVFDGYLCLRSWPFKMFWYYLFIRAAGYIDIERSSWDTIVAYAKKRIEEKSYIMIFPEGHRSRTGNLGRFYSGAFKLSVELKIPILPLCISGTQTLLPPGRFWLKPATVVMEQLEPVYSDAFMKEDGHIEMRKYVKQKMAETVSRLEKEYQIA